MRAASRSSTLQRVAKSNFRYQPIALPKPGRRSGNCAVSTRPSFSRSTKRSSCFVAARRHRHADDVSRARQALLAIIDDESKQLLAVSKRCHRLVTYLPFDNDALNRYETYTAAEVLPTKSPDRIIFSTVVSHASKHKGRSLFVTRDRDFVDDVILHALRRHSCKVITTYRAAVAKLRHSR